MRLACVFVLFAFTTPALAQTLLGNTAGIRPALATEGITLDLNDSENLLGNLSGGLKQGATLQGTATADLQIDLGKALNLTGATLNVSALQIHGRPLSPYYLDDIQTANGNEADNATRLWELWLDQTLPLGTTDLKLGQQSIDNEFITSSNSALFVNTMAGWPLIPSDDLYAGGPAYPLSSLGARLQTKPTGNVTLLAGVFDDNPPGDPFNDDPQSKDAGGVRFSLKTGALFIAELQYARPNAPHPGTYKLGLWVDTAYYPDEEFPENHKGNYSLYAVIDQALTPQLNTFARIMGAPTDQNFITFSINGGLTSTAPLPGRPNDTAGLDIGYGQVSSRAADSDATSGLPRRSGETLIELTYQAQATPWLILQPDVQYIINPGAGIQDPDNDTHLLRNELVAGLRAVTTF